MEAAARRYPECEWVVANADRFIPYRDARVLTGHIGDGAHEFGRIPARLRDEGRLLWPLPAPGDLIELRGPGRDRVDRTIQAFAPDFVLADRRRIETAASLDTAEVKDLLVSIYRPMGSKVVCATRVTFSLDLILFHTRGH